MSGLARPVPLPVHPASRAGYFSLLADELRFYGVATVREKRLSQPTGPLGSPDALQRRINHNLQTAFDQRELQLFVDEEIMPIGLAATRAPTPGPTMDEWLDWLAQFAPGFAEIFGNPHVFHGFREWAEILWGADINAIPDDLLNISALLYVQLWLPVHIQVSQDIQEFLNEIGLGIGELLDAIQETIDKAGDLLNTLFNDVRKWLSEMFGFSF